MTETAFETKNCGIQVLYLGVWLLKGLATELLRQELSLAQRLSCKCLPLWEEEKLANLAHTIPKSWIRCASGSHWNDASERLCKALKETKTYSSQQSSGYTSAVPCWDLWPLSSAGSEITTRLDSTFLVRIIWTAKIENEAFFANAASCFAFHKGSGSSRVSFPAFDWLLEYRPRVCYNPSSCHGYGLMYLQICSRQSCLEDRKCRTIRFIGTNRD